MDDHSLQAATPDDARTIAGWVADAAELMRFAGPAPSFPLDPTAFLADASDDHDVLVLRRDGRPVATAQCWLLDEHTARLGRILVDPARRGEGLGRLLVTELLAHVARRWPAVTTATLGVFRDNHPARRLYDRMGFAGTGEQVPTPFGDEVWTAVQMRIVLPPRTAPDGRTLGLPDPTSPEHIRPGP